ncbi:hypothetical protein [Brachyspira sp. G79]|uniref:hypothetical protein n=1 Tax=Brachyspira sp. G79 TaxID=1358104 RepID=UPI000BBBA71A|nr:hypothetical protein [Brachyspira sp. G79]
MKDKKDNFIEDMLKCSKSGHYSSMRLISTVGSLTILFCIVWLTIKDTQALSETIMSFGIILGFLVGGKTIQSKFENKEEKKESNDN